MTSTASETPSDSLRVPGDPFDVENDDGYAAWRRAKLARLPAAADLVVPIADPWRLTPAEYEALLDRLRRVNLVIYQIDPRITDKDAVRALGRQFGLERLDDNLCADEDSITSLQVSDAGQKREYIPYTSRRLSWHTDGYYNPPERQIRGIVMHCVRAAASGGENALLDHELAYILMRDRNPAWIRALMAAEAMTIPANISQGVELRGAQTGPVFSIEAGSGALHMRYSARTRNIIWNDDPDTRAAGEFLQTLWEQGNPYIYHHRLMPGQGIICNNTLHSRSGFQDGPDATRRRLLYRARYYDRVSHTGLRDIYPDSE